jgi:hypothetical protein
LEKLALMPASFKERGIWFGDLGRALEMSGAPQPDSMEEMRALSDTERDAYSDAGSGIVLAPGFLGRVRSEPEWEQVFGFSGFGVTLGMSTGESSTGPPPRQMAYMGGDFDVDLIRQRLLALEYEEKEASSETYYSIRDDYQWAPSSWPGRFALGSMNPVFVGADTFIAASATDMVTDILAAWAGETPSLATDLAFSSLAEELGDPLSAASSPGRPS